MHHHYKDILERIAEPPTWFDDRGVPRYGPFGPDQLGNIYTKEAALAEVSCQGCGRLFRVALTESFAERRFSLSDEIRLARVQYGDPPNVACCVAGASMSSIMLEVVEYWSRDTDPVREWRRDPAFEGVVGKTALDPPDTVADVLAACAGGARTVLIVCTSARNRNDVAGRLVAGLSSGGPVTLTYPSNWTWNLARSHLKGLVPDAEVGSARDERRIVLMNIGRIEDLRPRPDEQFVAIATPAPMNGAAEDAWKADAVRLAAEAAGRVRVELVLDHSRPMIEHPEAFFDASRPAGRRGKRLLNAGAGPRSAR